MSETNAELIARARGASVGGDVHLFLVEELAAALESATAYEVFAVLGTDEDGDEWITGEKYEDIEDARAYVKRFGGAVHRCSMGEWVKATP